MTEFDGKLRLPGGIDAVATRALLALINERWGAEELGVTNVLVWRASSTVESALPHLAEGLGLSDMAFLDAPPREFLAKGVDLLRRLGTVGAIEDALDALGYGADVVDIREDAVAKYDGSTPYSGAYDYGASGEWCRWHCWIDGDAIPAGRLREIWDVVTKTGRKTRPFFLHVRASNDVVTTYRSRADIVADSPDGGA